LFIEGDMKTETRKFKVGDKVRRKDWKSHSLFARVIEVRSGEYLVRLGVINLLWKEEDIEAI
jgi:dsDNA-specific endonuclease/ATPase MutS2